MSISEFQDSIENATDMEEMKEEIERTIDDNDIVIFMKGNQMMPQCGYSAKAVEIMQMYADEFETINILNDRRIKEALKEVSDWPTSPQVFVDGELLGGSDILAEMHENGELEEKVEAVN
ncbi:MAG: Grx4 family monothiol glutaredoxin [Halobacteria archaeon]